MGDLRAWSPEPSVVSAVKEQPAVACLNEMEIGGEYWELAEAVTDGIIAQVRPTLVSEKRRKAVIEYVQGLIRTSIGCEVFPFGSVPLKTYLPDGDVDLTAFGAMKVEEKLANEVCSVLEREDQNKAADFVVKDVQLIRAEVKLVKCLVQNVVVDISFNQLGGLYTLCFLEQVDRQIGKDHLFKRSIILIKAWCYYESRILGAHHGLISTYALETLVLYIFHLFHSSLNGPLAVLYKFLDYFSKFDWDNYCISLNGPVRISSLPEFVVEMPQNGVCNQSLSNGFLKECVEAFTVPARRVETNSRTFPQKHLNIVDPLKETNNLGRSVSKGNFYRIRSAFTYGARKLGRILSQPEANMSDELHKFFLNTLDRHGSGQKPNVKDSITMDQQYGFGATLQFPGMESCQDDRNNRESAEADSSSIIREYGLDHKQSLHSGVNDKASGRQMSLGRTVKDPPNSASGPTISENRLSGDAKDLATARIQGLSISSNGPRSSNPEETTSPMGKDHAPHLYFSCTVTGNGEIRHGNPEWRQNESSSFIKENSVGSANVDNQQLVSDHEVLSTVGSTNHHLLINSVALSSEDLYPDHSGSWASITSARTTVATTSLSDLSGDYESHINSLHYGRWCYENGSNASVPSLSVIAPFQTKNSWDLIRQSVQFRRNVFSQVNVNGAVPGRVFYPMSPPLVPGASFGMEEMPKPRGTGTYFPNTNHRPLTARGRNQSQIRSPRNNGRSSNLQESLHEKNSREPSQTQFHSYQGGGKSGYADLRHSGSESTPYSNVNGSMHLSERVVEFGTTGHSPPLGEPLIESGKNLNEVSVPAQNVSAKILPSGMQRPEPVLAVDQDGIFVQSYQLKDEDDFPPLSDSSGKGPPVCMVKKVEKAEQ